MRRTLLAATSGVFAVALGGFAMAQTAPAPAATPAPPAAAATPSPAPAPSNPVVARVGDHEIHASDVAAAAQGLPPQLRGMPPQMLFPMLLDQMIDREALTIAARKQGLENDPAVATQMRLAEDRVLQNALLQKEVGPQVSDAALQAAYARDYAGKPGEPEIHARQILVPTEAAAKKIIDELQHGGDFAAIAKKESTDPAAASGGGDLGWFKKSDMLPEFSAAAFAMKPGEISTTPVHTRFGWHIIKVEGTRTAPPPAFAAVRAEIRQKIIEEAVTRAVNDAKQGLTVVKFNPDGSVPTPPASPPASPAPASGPASTAPAAPASSAPASAAPVH